MKKSIMSIRYPFGGVARTISSLLRGLRYIRRAYVLGLNTTVQGETYVRFCKSVFD
jgi:hypothetical protein